MKLVPLIIILILADQFTKFLAVKFLATPIRFFSNIGFQLSYNEGIAFSLPLRGLPVIIISIIIIIGLLIFAQKKLRLQNWRTVIPIGFIVAGALSNVIDRLRLGAVIDFIRLGWWPTFNLADTLIILGCLLLIIFYDNLKKEAVS